MRDSLPAAPSLVRRGLRRLHKELRWRFSSQGDGLSRARDHHWVFVVGCNRSGKTMLSNLLSHHPEVTVIPNANWHTKALPDSRTERVPHVWAERLERFRLTESSEREPSDRLAFDWLHFADRPRKVIVVESDLATVQMRWLQEIFPNARFIGMLRNGYAVAGAIRLKEGYAIGRCARHWRISTEVMLNDAGLVPHFELVRYERFTDQPDPALERIAAFSDLDPAPLRPLLTSGWRIGNIDRNQVTVRNSNAEVTSTLTPEEVREIQAEAAALLGRLSYDGPGGAGDVRDVENARLSGSEERSEVR